jgi:hypothetical protein
MSQDPNQRRRNLEDENSEMEPTKSRFNVGMIAPVLISVVLSLVLVYLLFNPTQKMASKDVEARLTTAQTEMTKKVTDLVAPYANLKDEITTANKKQIEVALSNVPSSADVINAKSLADNAIKVADNAKNQADSSLNMANSALSETNNLKQSVSALQQSVKTTTDNTAVISSLQSDLVTLKTTVTTQESKIKALQTVVDELGGDSTTITDDGDTVTTNDISIKVTSGSRVILGNVGNTFAAPYNTDANYTSLKFRLTNKSNVDVTIYELKLNLSRYKYNGSSNLEDYDFEISPNATFAAGKTCFYTDSSSSSKAVLISSTTYDIGANDYLDVTVYIRAKFNSGYDDFDSNTTYYLRLTPSMSITDWDTND